MSVPIGDIAESDLRFLDGLIPPNSSRGNLVPGLSRRSRRSRLSQNIISKMMFEGRISAMLTRRTMLLTSAAAGALLALRSGNAHAAAPSTVKTPVNFDVPRGACDCHVHV